MKTQQPDRERERERNREKWKPGECGGGGE